MANVQTAVAGQARHPAVFRELTRPNSVPCGSQVFTAFGAQPQLIHVPHAGWLAKLLITCTGTLTTGAGTPASTWTAYPPLPWSLFRRIRVVTNTQTEIVNMTGWGLALMNKIARRLASNDQDLITNYNSTNRAALLTWPTAVAASTVYNVAAAQEVFITTDDALFLGALFLQSDVVSLDVEITPPTAGDIHTITGVTVTPALTYSVQAVFYEQPPDLAVRPNAQYVHTWREESRPLPGTGLQPWILPSGNTYLKICGVVENNGAQLPNSGLLGVALGYAQTQTPINEPYLQHLFRARSYYGQTLPDGMFVFDETLGSGIPGLYEGRDFLNSARNTDLQVTANISSAVTLADPRGLRLMTEQLQAIG